MFLRQYIYIFTRYVLGPTKPNGCRVPYNQVSSGQSILIMKTQTNHTCFSGWGLYFKRRAKIVNEAQRFLVTPEATLSLRHSMKQPRKKQAFFSFKWSWNGIKPREMEKTFQIQWSMSCLRQWLRFKFARRMARAVRWLQLFTSYWPPCVMSDTGVLLVSSSFPTASLASVCSLKDVLFC